jgi:6-methylsalicylate decarboxylase
VKPHRIDVHHHLAPPAYIAELGPKNILQPQALDWVPEKSIEDMDRAGISTAVTSIAQQGCWFGDDAAARRLARACNDYAARLVADHPGRFGMFTTLPLPDIEGSLLEIEYGLDVLGAEGVCMLTSYGGKWLGDPHFSPVFEELNRRKALVYTHPIAIGCCVNLVPDIPDVVIEYGTDTTRAIASLVFSGTAARYPDVRIIFSHAGGTMPFLIGRFMNLAEVPHLAARLPDGVLPLLQRFNYEVAQATNPGTMSSLLQLVPVSQVLFGTDFPFRTGEKHVRGLNGCGLSAADLQAIYADNALALMPRLATVA